jgi:hypothetical protein
MGELVPLTGGAAAALPALPPSVAGGIEDLMVAFAAPTRDDEDTRRLLRIYVEAVSQFDVAIAESALRDLKFHNPRNPFRPTPQDVFEACEATAKKWSFAVEFYFLGDDDWRSDLLGSAPLTAGCVIPDRIVKATLKAALHAMNASVYRRDDYMCNMRLDRITKIPEEVFAEGQREEMMRMVASREEHYRRNAQENARQKAEQEKWMRDALARARAREADNAEGR